MVVDSRGTPSNQGRRRRRRCKVCKHRWTTIEINVLTSQSALKKELVLEYRKQIVASVKEDFHKAIDIVFKNIEEL